MPWTEVQIDAAAMAIVKLGMRKPRDIARAVLATVEPQCAPVDSWRADVERRLAALEPRGKPITSGTIVGNVDLERFGYFMERFIQHVTGDVIREELEAAYSRFWCSPDTKEFERP